MNNEYIQNVQCLAIQPSANVKVPLQWLYLEPTHQPKLNLRTRYVSSRYRLGTPGAAESLPLTAQTSRYFYNDYI